MGVIFFGPGGMHVLATGHQGHRGSRMLRLGLPLALGLGIVLIAVVLAVNAGAYAIREWSARHHG